MGVSSEYLESVIKNWAENLWMLNNQARITDNQSRETITQEFYDLFYPSSNRGLTRAQNFSEQSFTMTVHGVCHTVGRVSQKTADIILDNKLVDVWRKSVWRNSFQQRYAVFESCLKETLDKFGSKDAIEQYPKTYTSTGGEVVEAFESIGYKSKLIDPKAIRDLIKQAAPATSKGSSKAPKGP